nr:transglutaminase-like cysteine peptidase [Mesorhizobium xinjiangense]
MAHGAGATPAGAFMPTGSRTSQPIGHFELCQRDPAECRRSAGRVAPVKLSPKLWDAIIEINDEVNRSVTPMTDREIWGIEEYWSYPDSVGDCEDFVLEKRRRLIALGVPAANLLITVVKQPNDEGHAVLSVRTDLGDFILDNIESRVLAWTDTEYRYLKRQSERNAGAWVSIEDGRDVAVGSVR